MERNYLWPELIVNIKLFEYSVAVVINSDSSGGFFVPKTKILTGTFRNEILFNSIDNVKSRGTKVLK